MRKKICLCIIYIVILILTTAYAIKSHKRYKKTKDIYKQLKQDNEKYDYYKNLPEKVTAEDLSTFYDNKPGSSVCNSVVYDDSKDIISESDGGYCTQYTNKGARKENVLNNKNFILNKHKSRIKNSRKSSINRKNNSRIDSLYRNKNALELTQLNLEYLEDDNSRIDPLCRNKIEFESTRLNLEYLEDENSRIEQLNTNKIRFDLTGLNYSDIEHNYININESNKMLLKNVIKRLNESSIAIAKLKKHHNKRLEKSMIYPKVKFNSHKRSYSCDDIHLETNDKVEDIFSTNFEKNIKDEELDVYDGKLTEEFTDNSVFLSDFAKSLVNEA